MPPPPVVPTDPPRRFGRAVWQATAPLWLWALHFFGLYVGVAAGCTRGWGEARWAGLPLVSLALGAFSAAVLALLAWMTWRAARDRDWLDGLDPTVAALRLGGGALALVGTAWETVPLLLIPPCGSTVLP